MKAQKFYAAFQSRSFLPLTVASLSLLVIICGVISSTAQSPNKDEREIADRIPQHLPIKVKVMNEEKVKDLKNDNWLGDLEIEVKNIGDKPIYFLRLGLTFVDVKKDSGNEIGYSLVYGRAELIDIDNRAKPEDVPILPGATYVFKLHESYVKGWNWYRTRIEKKPHPKKIAIRFDTLNFGDGTGYVTSGGLPVLEKQSSYGMKRKGGWADASTGASLLRTTNSSFQYASFLIPAGNSPVKFSIAKAGDSLLRFMPTQSCCPGNCERMKLALGSSSIETISVDA